MAVFVAMISQFLVGYNTAVMNAPAAVVFPGHSTTEWSLAVSAFAIGGPFGAMIGGLLANKRGRRSPSPLSPLPSLSSRCFQRCNAREHLDLPLWRPHHDPRSDHLLAHSSSPCHWICFWLILCRCPCVPRYAPPPLHHSLPSLIPPPLR
jgi:hypothetical protein